MSSERISCYFVNFSESYVHLLQVNYYYYYYYYYKHKHKSITTDLYAIVKFITSRMLHCIKPDLCH